MKKRSDGRYTRKITLPDGSRKYVYGTSIPEVNQKAREMLNAADAGIKLDDDTTVGEWAVEWFSTYKQGLRPATLTWYKSTYNLHIYPLLQKLPLRQVKPVHIQKVMNEVAGNSESLQRKVLSTMWQIFTTARLNGLILRDPTEGVKITPRKADDRIKVLSPEQQQELMEAVQDPRALLFCALGLYCGLRRGEILGLTWPDIHDNSIEVNRSLKFVNGEVDVDRDLKNKSSYRSVPITPPLQAILDEIPHEDLCLFSTSKGRPVTRRDYRSLLYKVQSSVDFHVHPHMLRHTYATSLYHAGIDLKTAQYLLGHSNIATTADIYTHIGKSCIEDARKKLLTLWAPEKDGQNALG